MLLENSLSTFQVVWILNSPMRSIITLHFSMIQVKNTYIYNKKIIVSSLAQFLLYITKGIKFWLIYNNKNNILSIKNEYKLSWWVARSNGILPLVSIGFFNWCSRTHPFKLYPWWIGSLTSNEVFEVIDNDTFVIEFISKGGFVLMNIKWPLAFVFKYSLASQTHEFGSV